MTKEKQEQLEDLLRELEQETCPDGGACYINLSTYAEEIEFHLCDGMLKDIIAYSLEELLALNADYEPERAKQLKIEKLKAELAELETANV